MNTNIQIPSIVRARAYHTIVQSTLDGVGLPYCVLVTHMHVRVILVSREMIVNSYCWYQRILLLFKLSALRCYSFWLPSPLSFQSH